MERVTLQLELDDHSVQVLNRNTGQYIFTASSSGVMPSIKEEVRRVFHAIVDRMIDGPLADVMPKDRR